MTEAQANAGTQAAAQVDTVRTHGREALAGKRVRVTVRAVLRDEHGNIKTERESSHIEEVEA